MQCPLCGSERTKKCGLQRGHQRYKCKECGRKFQGDAEFQPKRLDLPDNADILLQIDKRYSAEELRAIAAGQGTIKTRKAKPIDFSGDIFKVLCITDTHWGSQYVEDAWYDAAIAEAHREGVSELWHAGDVVEGMSGRDGHIYELKAVGYRAQRDLAVSKLRRAELPIKAIAGNHDLWYLSKGDMGADIVEDICSRVPGAEYLGPQEADIPINGITVRLFHGEDAAAYALSWRLQKLIESFTGGEKPNALITGHDHKSMYLFDRNVHAIACGCLQRQTPWMRRKKMKAMPGFWIITFCIRDAEIKYIDPRFYPYYN
jgi:predicted phosphodiesterase